MTLIPIAFFATLSLMQPSMLYAFATVAWLGFTLWYNHPHHT